MATETSGVIVMKAICDRLGCVEYEDLLDKLEVSDVDNAISNRDMFTVIEQKKSKKILATSTIRRCKGKECRESCADLHLCKFHLLGQCYRKWCKYGHSLKTEHNSRVLREHGLQDLTRDQLRVLLLQNDSSLLPTVCVSYNKGSGDFGNCPDKEDCVRLHICEKYIRGLCDGSECNRSHDFYEPHPAKTLHARGVSSQLIVSVLQIYQNILSLRDHRNARDNPSGRGKETDRDKCSRVHCGLPYKWQVEVDEVWIDLPDNEVIERDYCDPAKIHSVGGEPVCFDTMMQGVHRVQRLSTVSSSHTTKWSWYWENEYNKWIQYGSIKEMHRLATITSEDLEKKYLRFLEDNSYEVVKFTAGKQCYELNFRAMMQRNEISSTERAVRRRPRFVSLFDVRTARTTRRDPNFSRTGVPGFWDKNAIPKSGFQLVLLDSSHKDYVKVQEHFNKTMKDFSILSIQRVQNKELWEDFQTKRERMKKANSQKKYGEAEHLLFHGTNCKNIDAICRQNFDMRVSGANATVYGQGTYFARDAKYSNDYADQSKEKVMFACRVLVGQYTKGKSYYRRPPAKDAAENLYDSCVNEVCNPSIYVVFERSQIYPEFLITYEKTSLPKDVQSSIFFDTSQTARSVTHSPYVANATSSDSTNREKAFSFPSMPSALASPLNSYSQKDEMMLMTESLNVFRAATESEQSNHSKPTQSGMLKEPDQGLSTSVTNPVSANSDNPLTAAKPSLRDNSIHFEVAKDQHKTSTLWTSNISTERMSQNLEKSAPHGSPELDKSIPDAWDPISWSSDRAQIFDASSTTGFSEMKSKSTMPQCKSPELPLCDTSYSLDSFSEIATQSVEVLKESISANPEEESCTSTLSQSSLSSTGSSRKPAQDLLTSKKVSVSSHSLHDRQLPILTKDQQSSPQQGLSAINRQFAANFSHPLLTTSPHSPAKNLNSDFSSAKESIMQIRYTTSSFSAEKRPGFDGSSSSSLVSFHEIQPPSSAPSSTSLNRQASQQKKDLKPQKEEEQSCSLQ